MEMAENIHCSACLWLDGSRGIPANTEQLCVPRDFGTAAEIEVYRVDAVRVYDDKLLVAVFRGWAEAARGVSELNAKAKFTQCCTSEKKPVPFLRKY